jgi:hypothetical protein
MKLRQVKGDNFWIVHRGVSVESWSSAGIVESSVLQSVLANDPVIYARSGRPFQA